MSGFYEKQIHIVSADADMWQRLRPGVLARMLQEAAIAHSEELGAGHAATFERGALWILTRMAVEVTRLPMYREDVLLRTWPGRTMHVLFPRYYEMTTAAGEPLLRASSLWLLMWAQERKMAFPRELGITVEGAERGGEPPLPDRAVPFPPELPGSEARTVRFSETDLNGHLNNTRYLDWADDLLTPAYHREHALRALWVEYRSEILCGQTAVLRYAMNGDTLYLRGQAEEKESFRLKAEYGTI